MEIVVDVLDDDVPLLDRTNISFSKNTILETEIIEIPPVENRNNIPSASSKIHSAQTYRAYNYYETRKISNYCEEILKWIGVVIGLTSILAIACLPITTTGVYYADHIIPLNYTITKYETLKRSCSNQLFYPGQTYENTIVREDTNNGRWQAVPWTISIYGSCLISKSNLIPGNVNNATVDLCLGVPHIIVCGNEANEGLNRAKNFYPKGTNVTMWTWDSDHTFITTRNYSNTIVIFWISIAYISLFVLIILFHVICVKQCDLHDILNDMD